MRLSLLLITLFVVSLPALGQIIEPNMPKPRRALVENAIQELNEEAQFDEALIRAITDTSLQILRKNISDKRKTNELITKLSEKFTRDTTTVAEYLQQGELPLPSGSISLQGTGNLKTNIQAYKFIISRSFLNTPLYLTLSPEVPLSNGKETEKEKALRILNSTGGSFGAIVKKYYTLVDKGDFSTRWNWFTSANYTSYRDTLSADDKIDGNVDVGVGLNLEARLVGDGDGILWIEAHGIHHTFLGDSFSKVFAISPKKSFFGVTIIGQLSIIDLIELKVEWYKSFSSGLPILDDGVGVVSLGFSTNLRN